MAFQFRNPPLYNSYHHRNAVPRRNSPGITIKVASSVEDLFQVLAIRASVYMAEQFCPYREEFDGNDFCGSHLIGYSGDEPAASLRIRYFASFAKLERLAVRREYRQSRIAFAMVRAGIRLCQKKGYGRLYGHAREGLVEFWSRFGARKRRGRSTFTFSDHTYTEMVVDVRPDEDAITIDSDPFVIIRPEGQWDYPGVLEASSLRSQPGETSSKS